MSSNKTWKLKPPSSLSSQLAREVGITPLQAQLLINRGISDPSKAESFLHPRLADLADPMLLKGMDDALPVILNAIHNGDSITIYGDYDADGLTATALLSNFFSDLDIPVSYYIPNRLSEGYGLNKEAIKNIAASGTDLIITVDCGASNGEEVAFAVGLGMNVVISDHHQVPMDFRPDFPIVDPHQPGCLFPFKDPAGVGMAFFLAVAIRAALREKGWFGTGAGPDLRQYLDLVALGTVADRVPLLGQNRILVNSGIGFMAGSRWAGIWAMMEVADVRGPNISAEDLAFRLGPRLNAPGRIGDPNVGIKLLTSDDMGLARGLARKINAANGRRQRLEQDILEQIEDRIKAAEGIGKRRVLFLGAEDWHKGVLGIVASRLVNRYHRPSLIFTVQDGKAVGSGRSIDGFNLYENLSRFGHLFEKFGGHYHAAGFTLKSEKLESLETGLEEIAKEVLNDGDLVPSIDVDAEISFQDINHEFIARIKALSPFGEGNPEPIFLARSLEVLGSRVVGERHLKLNVRQGNKTFDAIGFGLGYRHSLKGETVDMVFTPELNEWQGYERIQLRVVDLKSSFLA
ncbi:MAG: single-stranded-DNA-specific exonuclease RecJ [Desulfobacterales bacterium]|nr:single-stranded-DNA-specific exonuclease RecJ [Desulfobacterales bacterium]